MEQGGVNQAYFFIIGELLSFFYPKFFNDAGRFGGYYYLCGFEATRTIISMFIPGTTHQYENDYCSSQQKGLKYFNFRFHRANCMMLEVIEFYGVFLPAGLVLPGAPVSYTHLRAHETVLDLVCRLLLEKKK